MNKTGQDVKDMQFKLKAVLNRSLSVDGDYGRNTRQAVADFQKLYNLSVSGLADISTLTTLDVAYNTLFKKNSGLLNFGSNRFIVFVDAGHGGIDDKGLYTTPGKRAHHKDAELHERGHYYEGYENRIIAESFIEALTANGIMYERLYHPFKDTSLSDRTELTRAWLRRGYYGYMHSMHSNAISEVNSPAKLESTTGYCVYTGLGNTFSDEIATQQWNHVKELLPDWNLRTELSDGDVDHEANFQMLRQTDLVEFDRFGAILDEWGFHTSAKDCKFIINSRKERVQACLNTALWVKSKLDK